MTARDARQIARGDDEGEAVWLLGGLYRFRAAADETGAAYSLRPVKR